MHLKTDMVNHQDSVLMTVITVGLYVFHHELQYMGVITGKIVSDGIIGLVVMLSAVSTAALNGYKFWQMWKERQQNKTSNKNSQI